MNEKTASVHWEGRGKRGLGKISTGTGALEEYPYSVPEITLQAMLR